MALETTIGANQSVTTTRHHHSSPPLITTTPHPLPRHPFPHHHLSSLPPLTHSSPTPSSPHLLFPPPSQPTSDLGHQQEQLIDYQRLKHGHTVQKLTIQVFNQPPSSCLLLTSLCHIVTHSLSTYPLTTLIIQEMESQVVQLQTELQAQTVLTDQLLSQRNLRSVTVCDDNVV